MSRVMDDLLTPLELFQRHCSRPVKIIIRVRRYTILSLAEGYANFRYVAFFFDCESNMNEKILLCTKQDFYYSSLSAEKILYLFHISSSFAKESDISCFCLIPTATISAFSKLIGATIESTKDSILLFAISV